MITYLGGAVGFHVFIEDSLGVEGIGRVAIAGVVIERV